MTTPEQITEIRKRLEKASPRPWKWESCGVEEAPVNGWDDHLVDVNRSRILTDGSARGEYSPDIDSSGPDAEFIAHAPEDIAMLLEERDQLKAQIEEMRVAMWPTINFYLRSKIKELEDSRIVAWWSKYLLAGDLHKIVNVYKKYFGRGPTS